MSEFICLFLFCKNKECETALKSQFCSVMETIMRSVIGSVLGLVYSVYNCTCHHRVSRIAQLSEILNGHSLALKKTFNKILFQIIWAPGENVFV